jgi:hypothetical protein
VLAALPSGAVCIGSFSTAAFDTVRQPPLQPPNQNQPTKTNQPRNPKPQKGLEGPADRVAPRPAVPAPPGQLDHPRHPARRRRTRKGRLPRRPPAAHRLGGPKDILLSPHVQEILAAAAGAGRVRAQPGAEQQPRRARNDAAAPLWVISWRDIRRVVAETTARARL